MSYTARGVPGAQHDYAAMGYTQQATPSGKMVWSKMGGPYYSGAGVGMRGTLAGTPAGAPAGAPAGTPAPATTGLTPPPGFIRRSSGLRPPASARGEFPAFPSAPTPGMPQINTSITPSPVYSARDTRGAVNQAIGDIAGASQVPALLHRTIRPGVSLSRASQQQIIPALGEAAGQARLARQEIPFQHAAANAANILSGQIGRANEFSGLASVGLNMQNQLLNSQYGAKLDLIRLLSQFMF